MNAGAGDMSDEDEWFQLRLAFLRERVVHNGGDKDYAALVKQLMLGQKTYGNAEYLTEAAAELEQARTKYPNPIAVWEYSALFDSLNGTEQDFNRSLGGFPGLDPDSSIIRALHRITPADTAEWDQQAMDTARQLLENSGSADPAVSAAAIAGLQDWARTYPKSSTYAINLSLGLVSAGRVEEARSTALSAAGIEDGSFEDAYISALCSLRPATPKEHGGSSPSAGPGPIPGSSAPLPGSTRKPPASRQWTILYRVRADERVGGHPLHRVRRSGSDPAEVSTSLRALAEEAAHTRPATARLARLPRRPRRRAGRASGVGAA